MYHFKKAAALLVATTSLVAGGYYFQLFRSGGSIHLGSWVAIMKKFFRLSIIVLLIISITLRIFTNSNDISNKLIMILSIISIVSAIVEIVINKIHSRKEWPIETFKILG